MNKEIITLLPKWKLKKKLYYFRFPVEIQRETEKAVCVRTFGEDGRQFYAGWIPKKVITERKPY
jgi:hypothetical protein